MIISKLHERGKELVLAACDADLIGKTLITKDEAEVFINPKFYKGEIITPEKLLDLMREATIVNLFGEETITAAKNECGRIINIQGVPHAQIIRIL
jgi:hypothetical protein